MSNESIKFTVILEQEEDGRYSVHCPAVNCSSQGEERAEALVMIVECIQIVLDEYENTKESNSSLVPLPQEETPGLISAEVQEILEFRVEYEMPMTLEIVQVLVPAQVLV